MVNLDIKDRKILFELELNARLPETQLAKKTGLSREVVAYRIKKLEKRKIILKYHAIVNSMNLGKIMYRTYFKLQKTTPEKEREFVEYLRDKFNWITKIRGVWDIGTMTFVNNNYDFDDIMKETLSLYGKYIQDYWFAIMTRLHHCKKSYLIGKQDDTDIILEKTKHQIRTDDLDLKIINYLSKFGRAKYQGMARKFSVNEKLIRDRLKRLIENKVILAFTTFINIPLLDIKYYKLHFSLNDKSREIIKKMIAFGLAHPNIIFIVEGTGCADVEMEIQVSSISELYDIIDSCRRTFKEAIRDYVFMEYTEEYKFEYAD
ncbi:MAG: Lrp/AsnC family transcriptional regulator [Nanoarchaeota archaeon]|nr:Lrp/AsnC family transcriptional regulator [Nanoarchaeota archaeon]MCK5630783.1 Lrp/AsnC family transcriptional regulator [Nanoarchaeota archaeon]